MIEVRHHKKYRKESCYATVDLEQAFQIVWCTVNGNRTIKILDRHVTGYPLTFRINKEIDYDWSETISISGLSILLCDRIRERTSLVSNHVVYRQKPKKNWRHCSLVGWSSSPSDVSTFHRDWLWLKSTFVLMFPFPIIECIRPMTFTS